MLLNVDQAAELHTPRLVADAVGTFSVITGVVVPLATDDERSVPVVPKVSAATEVTVPPPPPLAVELIVWFGQVPVMVTLVPATNEGVDVPVPPDATAKIDDKPAAVPVVFWFNVGNVQFVKLPDAGVPNAGVTSVGELDKTKLPEPVDVVTPVPPFATASVPLT